MSKHDKEQLQTIQHKKSEHKSEHTTLSLATSAILAMHGYEWKQSAISAGGVATHVSGYKVAIDLKTGEWMHYGGRRDPSREGRGLDTLAAYLRKAGAR